MNKKIRSFCCQLLSTLMLTGMMAACDSSPEASDEAFQIPEGLDRPTELKFRQYAIQGRKLYRQHCANCHQADGSGLGKLIPPLAGSDYLEKNKENVLCIIRWGMEGPIVVNGQEYNQPMPPNPRLKDIEIAEIATYIFNAWGNEGEFIQVQQAQEWLKDCEQSR